MARKLKIAALSDIGNVRSNNEDNLYCNGIYKSDTGQDRFEYFNCLEVQDEMCFAVFDGMGGMARGEDASLAAVNVLADYQKDLGEKKPDFSEVIGLMNNEICNQIAETKKDMGSTAVLMSVNQDEIRVANVGDSRAYIYRDGELSQLSRDHTKANSIMEFKEKLGIDVNIDVSDMHNILSQHLGIREDEFILEPEITEKFVGMQSDIYMICSDGLTGFVQDETIAEILSTDSELKDKLFYLRDEALKIGGEDNITIILLERIGE